MVTRNHTNASETREGQREVPVVAHAQELEHDLAGELPDVAFNVPSVEGRELDVSTTTSPSESPSSSPSFPRTTSSTTSEFGSESTQTSTLRATSTSDPATPTPVPASPSRASGLAS